MALEHHGLPQRCLLPEEEVAEAGAGAKAEEPAAAAWVLNSMAGELGSRAEELDSLAEGLGSRAAELDSLAGEVGSSLVGK